MAFSSMFVQMFHYEKFCGAHMKFIFRDSWTMAMAFSEVAMYSCGASRFRFAWSHHREYAYSFQSHRQPWSNCFTLNAYNGEK